MNSHQTFSLHCNFSFQNPFFFPKKPSAWPIIARRRSDSLRSEVLSEKWGNCGPFCTPKKVIHLVTTVDGRNPAPAAIYETLCKVGYSPYQLVQEFFHQRCRSDIVQQKKITQKLSVRSCRFSISAEEAHLQVEHQPSMNIYPPMALAIDPGDPGSVENGRNNEAFGSLAKRSFSMRWQGAPITPTSRVIRPKYCPQHGHPNHDYRGKNTYFRKQIDTCSIWSKIISEVWHATTCSGVSTYFLSGSEKKTAPISPDLGGKKGDLSSAQISHVRIFFRFSGRPGFSRLANSTRANTWWHQLLFALLRKWGAASFREIRHVHSSTLKTLTKRTTPQVR